MNHKEYSNQVYITHSALTFFLILHSKYHLIVSLI